ncbi:MAG: trigger factor, partial [Planctomycetes bacterium]|nr:trigger factor [Planctomycetota bacterium]
RRFGWEVVQQEVLEHSSERFITQALEKAEIEPYAQIELDGISWDPLLIKIKIPLKPRVELGNYRAVRLEVEPVEVADEDVEQRLQSLQEQNATWAPVERPGEIGDLLSMSIEGKDGDEVMFEDESSELELIAPDKLDDNQPDLTTPLLGLSEGDNKTFTVTYPEEFENEQLAGKEITFTVEVSGVKVKELDPLDDEFAQQVSEVDTLEELKEDIRKNIRQQREQQRDLKLGQEALDKIIEEAEKLEWPLVLEEKNIDDELKQYEEQLKKSGMTLASYLSVQNKTEAELREEARPNVAARLKKSLVLGQIVGLEKLEVDQAEILEQAKIISDLYGQGDQIWRSILASESQQNMIANDVLSNKAIQRLAAIAKGEAPELDESAAEASEAETPAAEAPADEASEAETPAAETPAAEASEAEVSEAETSAAEASEAEVSEAETPAAEASEAETPEAETPEAE